MEPSKRGILVLVGVNDAILAHGGDVDGANTYKAYNTSICVGFVVVVVVACASQRDTLPGTYGYNIIYII